MYIVNKVMYNVCPIGFLCFDKTTFILLLLVCLVIVLYYININNTQLAYLDNKIKKTNDKIKVLNVSENFNQTSVENNNPLKNSWQNGRLYQINHDYSQILNPFVSANVPTGPITIPTRGSHTGYRQIGILIREKGSDNAPSKFLPLYAEQYYPGARQWNYYTTSDTNQSLQLSIAYKGRDCQGDTGCDEIIDGDLVEVEGMSAKYKARIYRNDFPRYVPYV